MVAPNKFCYFFFLTLKSLPCHALNIVNSSSLQHSYDSDRKQVLGWLEPWKKFPFPPIKVQKKDDLHVYATKLIEDYYCTPPIHVSTVIACLLKYTCL